MEMVIDIFMEIVMEVFVQGFISLWFWIFPNKQLSEKSKKLFKVICAVISIGFLVALFAGIVLLFDPNGNSTLGWILVSLVAAYLIIGIVLHIVFCVKKKSR